MSIKTIFLGITLTLLLTNCKSYDLSRRTIEQGNLLPEKTVQRLKVGMSKSDTAVLLGSSLLSSTFNNDRWDYAYTSQEGNGPMLVKNVTLYFSRGSLIKIEHKP